MAKLMRPVDRLASYLALGKTPTDLLLRAEKAESTRDALCRISEKLAVFEDYVKEAQKDPEVLAVMSKAMTRYLEGIVAFKRLRSSAAEQKGPQDPGGVGSNPAGATPEDSTPPGDLL